MRSPPFHSIAHPRREKQSEEHNYPAEDRREVPRPHPHRCAEWILARDDDCARADCEEQQPGEEVLFVDQTVEKVEDIQLRRPDFLARLHLSDWVFFMIASSGSRGAGRFPSWSTASASRRNS